MTELQTTGRRGIFTRLYHGETNYNFIGRRRRWFAFSGIIIALGLLSLGTRGLDFGIEFEGGSSWEFPAGRASVEDAREALPTELQGAKIQELGGSRLRVQARTDGDIDSDAVARDLARAADVSLRQVSVNEVGPSWGEEISNKARRALVFFLIAIFLYITLRFEWKMALATLAALVHDILVTVGVYSIFQFEVTPATVIAVLTILGYSIYDGIVVFDKVEENTRGLAATGRMTYADMVNVSLNEVLMRTLNTSITALLPILSLLVIGSLVLGATTLQEFAVALLVGLGASAYSSIFIASPLLAVLKEREPRYTAIRERLASRGGGAAPATVLTPGAAAAAAERGEAAVVTRPAARPAIAGRPTAPRGRKKGRRR